MKVVADSNIIVSAIQFGGKPQTLLELAEDAQIELFVSEPARAARKLDRSSARHSASSATSSVAVPNKSKTTV